MSKQLLEQLAVDRQQGHRRGLMISDDLVAVQSRFSDLLNQLNAQNSELLSRVLFLGADNPFGFKPAQRGSYLGSESTMVVIDGWQHTAFNEWLAVIDTLKAGGLLVLLCPKLDQWPALYQQQARAANDGSDSHANFIHRLAQLLPSLDAFSTGLPEPSASPWQINLPSEDQQKCVDAVLRCSRGRTGRPLVIRADRGRGKTSALGIAAAKLVLVGKKIVLCSLHRASVQAAFQRFDDTLAAVDKAKLEKLSVSPDRRQWGEAYLQFYSPQGLLDELPEVDLILIDEAAMLPISSLEKLIRHYPRVVLSSTVFGYEGSGRGFDIRLSAFLNAHYPQWRRQYLKQPIRWSETDPLEAALNSLFLLDAGRQFDNEVEQENSLAVDDVQIEVLNAAELSANQTLLKQVFALLVEAHYQTTPQDLVQLMDARQVLVVAHYRQKLVGVCQAFFEGEPDLAQRDPELLSALIRGQRRPKGNLVAQRLCNQFAEDRFFTLPSLRVSRIAVAANYRRFGVGGVLLRALENAAKSVGASFLSSSFAVTAEVLRFWLKQGFTPLYCGERRDTSSGSCSVIVAKALDADSQSLLNFAARQFCANLPMQFIANAELISGEVLGLLIGSSADDAGILCEHDIQNARRFSLGEISLFQARPNLCRALCALPFQHVCGWEWVIELFLLNKPVAQLIAEQKFKGVAELQQALQAFFATLVGQEFNKEPQE
ncbi:tRNA(Met) cytidine acetyltransferase [Spongiibacter sp. KMU-158]|uniref:tRNA(Met) cytidine acetyltransferase n=1 Tax=Spongiibacter pelagi TaxID=2760804 RepID=A0A927GVY8_9GAMM|nr:GNAT family N-acetyltransferase [Spongiibacter pelagi]MBD2859156.1 tRNA(Met) cytidine acetyltransferase [Spongiibacter pelagi]